MGYTNIPNELLGGGLIASVGSGPFAVYLILRKWRNGNGLAWPSFDRIITDTGLSRPTVCTSIKKLITAGWIRQVHRGTAVNDSSTYYVAIVENDERATSKEIKPVKELNQLKNLTETGKETLPELVKELNSTNTRTTTKTNTKTNTKAKTYNFEEQDMKVILELDRLVRLNNDSQSLSEPLDHHAEQIRLLREKGYKASPKKQNEVTVSPPVTIDRIRTVFKWLRDVDDFWLPSGNIQSGAKFRAKFGQLENGARKTATGNGKSGATQPETKREKGKVYRYGTD
jgi:DNA-binding transcriptional regulator GbsR (MarR family)